MARTFDREDIQRAMDMLIRYVPRRRRVYTILRHVSRSGMRREISLFVADEVGRITCLDYWVATVMGRKIGKHEGIVVQGCGMDMGYDLVSALGEILHNNSSSLTHEWL